MSAEKIGMELFQEVQKDVYDFLCFLCEKLDDEYKSVSIRMIKDWKEKETQMYGYKVVDNIKKDLAEMLRNKGIPFVECDINTEMSSCFIVPAMYVQQLETTAIELAKQKELVSETTLDAVNDFCYGQKNRERNTIEIKGKELADRLLQNLTKREKGERTALFNRECADKEQQIYKFHFPNMYMEEMNRALFKSIWELSGHSAQDIIQYDNLDLKRQEKIRNRIDDFFDQDNSKTFYIYDSSPYSDSFIKISEDGLEYYKDGINLVEEHVCRDNEETYETIERWMDTFTIPIPVEEKELDSLEQIKEKENKRQIEYYKKDNEYINDMKAEKNAEEKLARCWKDHLNERSIAAITEYMTFYDNAMAGRDSEYRRKSDIIKETLSQSQVSRHIINSNDLSMLQRTKIIDKEMEKKMEHEIQISR